MSTTAPKNTTAQVVRHGRLRIDEAAEEIFNLFLAERLESNINGSRVRQIPFLIGPPGQGKSAIVDQTTDRINEKYFDLWINSLPKDEADQIMASPKEVQKKLFQNSGMYWECYHLRLSQCEPSDIKGIPVYSDYKDSDGRVMTTAKFAPPDVFPIVGYPQSAGGRNKVIFLDELPQAVQVIQQLASALLDGKAGDEVIDPARTFFVIAGNRKEDRSTVFETPANIVNRVTTIEVQTPFSAWEDWALATRVNSWVVAFLKDSHQETFNQPVPEYPGPYGTPRAWTRVANLIDANPDIVKHGTKNSLLLQSLIGTVGFSNATKFYTWLTQNASKYSVSDIFAGKKVPYPTAQEKSIIYGIILEATYRLNHDLTASIQKVNSFSDVKLKDPKSNYTKEDFNKDVLSELKKTGLVDKINRIYSWVMNGNLSGEVDSAYAALLNKQISSEVKGLLNSLILMAPEFKEAKEGYLHLAKIIKS